MEFMRKLVPGKAILFIALLFLAGGVMADTQLTPGNGTYTAPGSAASPSLNITTLPPGSITAANWSPDRQLSAIIRSVRVRPTETPRQSPTPKIIEFAYTPPAGCIETNEEGGGGDDSGAGSGSSPAANATDTDIPGGVYVPGPTGQQGSFGGLGSEETKDGRIPDCLMRSLFMELLDDQELVDLITSSDVDLSHPTRTVLFGMTPGQYHIMDRKIGEDRGLLDYCYDTNPSPYWSWVNVNAVFETRNARPENFTTTLVVDSHGAEIPALSTTDTFEPDRLYNFTAYIPVKCQQAHHITNVKLNFTQVI